MIEQKNELTSLSSSLLKNLEAEGFLVLFRSAVRVWVRRLDHPTS
jgi:hypothetical protein